MQLLKYHLFSPFAALVFIALVEMQEELCAADTFLSNTVWIHNGS